MSEWHSMTETEKTEWLAEQDRKFHREDMDAFKAKLERDKHRRWWQAKECPESPFDNHPILCSIGLILVIGVAALPGIAMMSRTVACAIGANPPFC